MPARIRLENRRHTLSDSIPVEVTQTVILCEGGEIAALAEGDPLRYALELPLSELQSLRRAIGPILERQPQVRRVLEAIIEYKEQAASDSEPMSDKTAI
jgi:hypothetical protein